MHATTGHRLNETGWWWVMVLAGWLCVLCVFVCGVVGVERVFVWWWAIIIFDTVAAIV